MSTGSGRVNQKERTRRAIVAAAAELIGAGVIPSVSRAAEEALVSPATAYRYFPDQQSLIAAAAADAPASMADWSVPQLSSGSDPVARAEEATRGLVGRIRQREPLVRAVMGTSLLRSIDTTAPREEATAMRPGFRRAWIEAVLEPCVATLRAEDRRLLTLALGVCISSEALIALEDVMGTEPDEALDVLAWMARTLTHAVVMATPEPAAAKPIPGRSGKGATRRR